MSVFDNMPAVASLRDVLKINEPFCLANFPYMPFNKNNVKRILSESQITVIDTVFDNKVPQGGSILLYILKYKGNKKEG